MDLRIKAVKWEFLTWVIKLARKLFLLGFGPTGQSPSG